MRNGPVPVILKAQTEDGYWAEPGPGYNPKYRATVWSIISLAQLGAAPDDARVKRGAEYLLAHATSTIGALSASGAPSGAIFCHSGNLIAALLDLGYGGDPRLEAAIEWLARATTGEGMASPEEKKLSPRYYKSGAFGPMFACSANNRLPCAWGGLKAMHAFVRIPTEARSPLVRSAIDVGVQFLFSRDPAQADYPMGWNEKPNRSWWKFGYPLFYFHRYMKDQKYAQIREIDSEIRKAGKDIKGFLESKPKSTSETIDYIHLYIKFDYTTRINEYPMNITTIRDLLFVSMIPLTLEIIRSLLYF